MKKLSLLAIACTCAICSFAQTEETTTETKEYSKWSIAIEGGANTIRGISEGEHAWERPYNFNLGGIVEYTFTPIFGLGAQALYLSNNTDYFDSFVTDLTGFGSLNLTNLATPYRTGNWKKFNTYLNLGAGFGVGGFKKDGMDEYDNCVDLAAWGAVNLEYNVSELIAIFGEGTYRWHSTGDFNPAGYQNAKDFFAANVGVRFKLGKKDHIRNLDVNDWVADNTLGSQETKDAIAALNEKVDAAQSEIDKLAAENAANEKASKDDVDKLKEEVAKNAKDIEELASNSAGKSTATVAGFERNAAKMKTSDLDAQLGSVIETLKNTDKSIIIEGYSDNTGTEAINDKLSMQRAEFVKKYLVKNDVCPKKIITKGYGTANPATSNATDEGQKANRRVEIILK